MKRAGGVVVGVFIVACVASVFLLRSQSMEHYLETRTYDDLYYLPPPAWLRVMSLGHHEALADLIWMRALIYFGEEYEHQGTVRHVFRYGKSLLKLDPDFKRAYQWVGMAGLYAPQGSPIEFMEQSAAVLEEGANRFPDDGPLQWDAGATLAYEILPHLDKDDPKREAIRERANDYMMAAARLGAGPAWLVISNATQLKKLGENERAVRHLEEMYAVVRDPDVKKQISRHLMRLRDQAHVEAFQRANIEFEARRKETFPYVPEGLYVFLEEPVDVAAQMQEQFADDDDEETEAASEASSS